MTGLNLFYRPKPSLLINWCGHVSVFHKININFRHVSIVTYTIKCSTWVHPPVFFMGSVLLIFFIFCVAYYVSFRSEFGVVMSNVMTSLFQYSTSLLSLPIFQHHQRMEFTFHNPYVTLELVPSTFIFGTELSCWRKGYLHKATLIIRWSHHQQQFYDRHHDQVDRYEISIFQMTMDLLLFTYMVSFVYYWRGFYRSVYMSNTVGVVLEAEGLCLFANSGVQHISCCAFVLLVFVLCTLCCQFLWSVHFW